MTWKEGGICQVIYCHNNLCENIGELKGQAVLPTSKCTQNNVIKQVSHDLSSLSDGK